ncbi:YgfZ/GcvT domain-containing protein [Aurantiacibacter gangjinensis]|uniref:Aminomethyltransferase n=1 Tax=Aurantiacibacter gangjinensis TaxID=502682 RepID=A0A0G9MNF7_9SPHN|nr:folate-binding protein YgfZ [Aurantiacibacter gangjinensis]APE28221.1 Folate-dependent protein for Fe/S cluster synthesis/repair in oxidative stress [Aurantiacibacter gangjinensis]KLE32119.1 aminomethyltransferase [Aurantiacibacter gangjinensis]
MVSGQLTNRAVVRVSPRDEQEDAAAFLQGLLTNDVAGETPFYAALLTAQGKTMFDMLVWHDGRDVLLDCEAELAEELAKRLSLYRLRRAIDIGVDERRCVFWSREALPNGYLPNRWVPLTPATLVSLDPRLKDLGHRWIDIPQSDDISIDDAYRAHRLSLGVPEGRNELGDILWLETNAVELNGVSFTKGCYIGQENTARMNWRQKVNRRLIVVPMDRSEEKRRKAAHDDLGLAIDHLRVADIPDELAPDWLDLSESG